MKKVKSDYINNAESLWKLFEKTGNVSFYILYKKLSNDGTNGTNF